MSMITRVKANHWETLVPSFRIQPWSLPLCFLLGFLEWRRCDRGTLWTEPFCVSSICLCWRQVTPEGWAVNQRSTAAGMARLNVCSYAHYLCIFDHIDAHKQWWTIAFFPSSAFCVSNVGDSSHTQIRCIPCSPSHTSDRRIFISALKKEQSLWSSLLLAVPKQQRGNVVRSSQPAVRRGRAKERAAKL